MAAAGNTVIFCYVYFCVNNRKTVIISNVFQAVDLSSGHEPNHLVFTSKTRRQFFGAIQEAVNMEFPNATERRSITQLVSRLHQVWGNSSNHNTLFSK